jgi:potassium efflux system protein
MKTRPFACNARLRGSLRVWVVVASVSLAGISELHAQAPATSAATNGPATNAPTATAPTAISVGDIVTQAQTTLAWVKDLQTGLDPDQALQQVESELPKLTLKIDQEIAADSGESAAAATLNSLQRMQGDWQSLSDDLAAEQTSLSDRVRNLNQLLSDLETKDAVWKATLDAAGTAKAPPEITDKIKQVRATISAAIKNVQDHQNPLYTMQNKVAAQDARVKSGLDNVNKELDSARQQILQQNRPALWNPASFAQSTSGVVIEEKASLSAQTAALATYLGSKIGALLVHLLILVVLIFGFFWIRNKVRLRAEKEVALQDAAHVFDAPFANALLITLLAAIWLYPGEPRLLWAIIGATALIPAVIVTRRLIDSASFSLLYGAMIAFFVDQIRDVITPAGIISRLLFIFELLAVSVFLLVVLRFKHLSSSAPDQTRLKRITRLFLHVTFFVIVASGLANVFGYIKLSLLGGDGMLESGYLAIVLYAAVRIVNALTISALTIWPLSSLGMVRRHRTLLYDNATVAIRWIFFALWFVATLQFFQQRDLVWQGVDWLLWKNKLNYFNITFSLGAILAFPITVWAAFLISRFLRFVLEEEVYPHMSLSRGIPYAASTMVHYAILTLGFFAAVAATGAQLSQFAFLAGAFGVGLGFGLQNIMNNFVSGVILLFERPVKVGDIVQMDPTTLGTVERIGIRASVIRLTNGSELIVPNGNLISNPVTNWTLSDTERLIEIPVTIASKVDPDHVLTLLTQIAQANPNVLKNPAPQTLLATFGGTGMTFRVRAWIDSEQDWMRFTSDLSVAINSALVKENITLG